APSRVELTPLPLHDALPIYRTVVPEAYEWSSYTVSSRSHHDSPGVALDHTIDRELDAGLRVRAFRHLAGGSRCPRVGSAGCSGVRRLPALWCPHAGARPPGFVRPRRRRSRQRVSRWGTARRAGRRCCADVGAVDLRHRSRARVAPRTGAHWRARLRVRPPGASYDGCGTSHDSPCAAPVRSRRRVRTRTTKGAAGMYCPACQNDDSRVIDSRSVDEGQAIRRRRECPVCGHRFTTLETPLLTVLKRNGVTEAFSRDKLVRGVRRACQGRSVDEDD